MKSLRFAAASLITVALLGCATSPTGRSQFILVGEDQMASAGATAYAQMKSKQEIDRSASSNSYVSCISRAIVQELVNDPSAPDYVKQANWEVTVFKDDSPNAFALPGGKIGVHTGMMKIAETQAQLAAVIGHEVGHVWARHGAERMSQGIAAQTGMQVAQVLAGEPTAQSQAIMQALGLGAQVGVLLPFSRKHESEADEIGVKLMARAGFDPRGSVKLWQNMEKVGGQRPPEFMSTHPASSTRIQQLRAKMDDAMRLYNEAQARGKNPRCR